MRRRVATPKWPVHIPSMSESASARPLLFHAPGLEGRSARDVVRVEETEAGHVRSLRLAAGAAVSVTDGNGRAWAARLLEVGGRTVTCTLERELAARARLPVTLAFAVANKAHTLWLVEKATELGAAVLRPIEFARSRSVADAARSPAFQRKAERRTVAALKQCGGAWLPRLDAPVSLKEFADGQRLAADPAGGGRSGARILLARDGPALGGELADWRPEDWATVVVGPEGGLTTEEEEELHESGFRPARVAAGILRFETAGIAALAILAHHMEQVRDAGRPASSAPSGAGG